jgi:hypothetical protein
VIAPVLVRHRVHVSHIAMERGLETTLAKQARNNGLPEMVRDQARMVIRCF